MEGRHSRKREQQYKVPEAAAYFDVNIEGNIMWEDSNGAGEAEKADTG